VRVLERINGFALRYRQGSWRLYTLHLVVELLNYDEELLLASLPIKEYGARISAIEALTHDIRRLALEVDQPLKFRAGQYKGCKLSRTVSPPA
jgi:hypothetical protein